ncbi:MAG: hypothetical protein AB7I27_09205 [Bacteriovoracaceae bacterium]
MKFGLIFFIFSITLAYAKKEVRDFNHILIQNMQQDLNNQNDDQFKTKAGRAPASVTPVEVENPIKEESKIDKTVRQTGHKEW